MKMMNNTMLTNTKRSDQIFIRWLRDDYVVIGLYAFVLCICVYLSHYFSRFIPTELFETKICPAYHIAMLVVAVIGAILVHFNQKGIRARGAWRMSLALMAVLETCMVIAQSVYGTPVIIYEFREVRMMDLTIGAIVAIILLAYPAEVLCPRWLTPVKGTLLCAAPFAIWGLDYATDIDLRALLMLYPMMIGAWLIGKIPAYKEKCEDNFSSLENSAIRWIWIYLITLMVIGSSYLYISFTNHPTRMFTQQWLMLYIILYNTCQILLRRKPWQETEILENEPEEEEESSFPPEYRASFEEWMEKEKPYTNKDFRLQDLMQVLPLNRTYLSRFIKSEYGCNFYQLVTNYRVEEAKRLIKEKPELKMWEIAELSGFASAIVFNRTFKRETDQTPTEWMEVINNS